MTWLASVLTERLGVFRTWGSFGRVAAWVVVWVVVVSLVVAPAAPHFTDRAVVPDVPPSNVRYVAPLSHTDFAGYLPPPHDPDGFTVAWIGGSEVKLREVSVPGAVEQRVGTVGGRPLLVDSYNLIAPRMIDVLRAIDTADRSGADALVVALNPAWVRSEWSMRDWPNLDVANVGTLWSRRATWSWALALTGPDDYAWRVTRSISGIVAAQTRLNERMRDELDRLDLLTHPPADAAAVEPAGDPRLPPGSALWLTERYGTEVMADEDARVAALIAGVGVSPDEAEFFVDAMLDRLDAADVPVFLYATPFSPESLADPAFDARAREVEAFWATVAERVVTDDVGDGLIEIEPRSASRDHPEAAGTFLNNVHLADPGWFADVLVTRLCAQWSDRDPSLTCR